MRLPLSLASKYQCATTKQVRSWSYGAIDRIRPTGDQRWHARRTLSDQSIFGPVHDLRCACGKYKGADYLSMICDHCGVKVASSAVRRQRFGHVELSTRIRHPFGVNEEDLAAFPVLPASFFDSVSGGPLAEAYEELIVANDTAQRAKLDEAVARVSELILSSIHQIDPQNLQVDVLLRGLALVPRSEDDDDSRCAGCGYPLAGLRSDCCPACGRELSI